MTAAAPAARKTRTGSLSSPTSSRRWRRGTSPGCSSTRRSMRVPFVLAHQFREQLSDGTRADLATTVDHCTAWSLDFEVDDS